MRFEYSLDKVFEQQKATTLLINYEDETISSFNIQGKVNGSGSFKTTLVTENSTLPFTITLSSNTCDVLAQDGQCYNGNGTIDLVNILQACTCADNGGNGTDDSNDDIPGENGDQGSNLTIGSDSSDSTVTTGAVPDSIASNLVAAASTTAATSSLSISASTIQTASSISIAAGTIIQTSSSVPYTHNYADAVGISTLTLVALLSFSCLWLCLY